MISRDMLYSMYIYICPEAVLSQGSSAAEPNCILRLVQRFATNICEPPWIRPLSHGLLTSNCSNHSFKSSGPLSVPNALKLKWLAVGLCILWSSQNLAQPSASYVGSCVHRGVSGLNHAKHSSIHGSLPVRDDIDAFQQTSSLAAAPPAMATAVAFVVAATTAACKWEELGSSTQNTKKRFQTPRLRPRRRLSPRLRLPRRSLRWPDTQSQLQPPANEN